MYCIINDKAGRREFAVHDSKIIRVHWDYTANVGMVMLVDGCVIEITRETFKILTKALLDIR